MDDNEVTRQQRELEDAYVRGYQDGCEQAKAELQHRLAETDKTIDELRTELRATQAKVDRQKRVGNALLAKVRAVEAKFDRQQAIDDAVAAECDSDAPPT